MSPEGTRIDAANKLARAATAYAAAMCRSNGKHTVKTEHARLLLGTAGMDVFDDGNIGADRQVIMDEYNWDENGRQLHYDDAGELIEGGFDPAFVHTDDPCQSKGLRL